MSGAVVNIRCPAKGCRRLLLAVSKWPDGDSIAWNSTAGVWVERCAKHKEIRPQETIHDADARRASKGLPPVDRSALMVHVHWSTLRPYYLDATHRARAVDFLLP